MLRNVLSSPQFYTDFFKFYFQGLVTDLLFVLTDAFHKNAFGKIAFCLYCCIRVLGLIKVPIFDPKEQPFHSEEEVIQFNKLSAFSFVLGLMTKAFENLKEADHRRYIEAIFVAGDATEKEFKEKLRDYMIMLNVYTNTE